MSKDETAIAALINGRARILRLCKAEIVKRCGYQNVTKGLRRLDELYAGEFARSHVLLDALPNALAIEPSLLNAAVVATQEERLREHELRYRETFQPHAVIVCQRPRPEQIWLVALIGIDNLLRLEFSDNSCSVTYIYQAQRGLKDRQQWWKSEVLPCFGKPRGFIINYTAGAAVEFDLHGNPLRSFGDAVRIGSTSLQGALPLVDVRNQANATH